MRDITKEADLTVQMQMHMRNFLLAATRAHVLHWQRAEESRLSEFDPAAQQHEVTHPLFRAEMWVDVGELEEIVVFPRLNVAGARGVTEVGIKMRIVLNDEDRQQEITFDTDLELCAEAERSVREWDELVQSIANDISRKQP